METLKRDWSSTLKLRDVLVTISCLLIQPNPASALNEAAGKLASEDWDSYYRRAKLMTDIHAAIPSNMAAEVKLAQMRGEEIPESSAAKSQGASQGKERIAITPQVRKLQQVTVEDVENTRRRGTTQEPDSDPDSDWIPGPDKTSQAPTTSPSQNIFGIKGLGANMQQTTSPIRGHVPNDFTYARNERENGDHSGAFIRVTKKHRIHGRQPHSRLLPEESVSTESLNTPELLRFSPRNPFSAIQPNNQMHPLLREFSHTWNDLECLTATGSVDEALEKTGIQKRSADDSCVQRACWESKRFKKAGYDMARYNRRDFGPRLGVGRL